MFYLLNHAPKYYKHSEERGMLGHNTQCEFHKLHLLSQAYKHWEHDVIGSAAWMHCHTSGFEY